MDIHREASVSAYRTGQGPADAPQRQNLKANYVQGSCSYTVPQHKHRLIRCMGAGGGAGEGVLIAWGLCKVRLTQPLYEKCCVLYMYMHLVHIQCTHTGTVLEMMCSVRTYVHTYH